MISVLKWLIRVFMCHIFYRVEFINKENEEKLDKCIICPNHSNKVESAWIYGKTENICIMAKSELFKTKLLSRMYRYFGVFPIKRGEKDVRSLIHSINLFKGVEKRKLLIFPEGETIKKDRPRGVAKVGPAYIAYKAGVPIVPVYITKNVSVFSKVKIIYGEPMYVSKEVASDKEKLKEFSKEMLDTAYKLGEKR